MKKPEIHSSPFPNLLGVEVLEQGVERTVTALNLKTEHCNAHGIIHGGVIFSLADSAFGLAENCGEKKFVAMEMHIRFLRPAKAGGRLIATAQRIHGGRQTAFYRIDVEDETGRHIAALTGTGHIFE